MDASEILETMLLGKFCNSSFLWLEAVEGGCGRQGEYRCFYPVRALVRWGECLGLSRSDLSHIEVSSILEGLSIPVLDDIDLHYLDLAERGRRSVASAQTLKLSYLIRDAHE